MNFDSNDGLVEKFNLGANRKWYFAAWLAPYVNEQS